MDKQIFGGTVWSDVLIGTNGSKKLRFGYYLEVSSTSDVVETDALTMQVDMNGAWELTNVGVAYTYNYPDSDTINVKLISNGDYRITIV